MPRAKLPRKREPRKDVTVNDRQERFALRYVVDFDRVEAVKFAGYEVTDDASAHTTACRLLKNPHVMAVVLQQKAKIAEKLQIDAEGTIKYLRLVVMEAISAKDWTGAVSALREIAKFYGLYEIHNKQKRYTSEDAEKLQQELVQAGFDFTRVNDRSEN